MKKFNVVVTMFIAFFILSCNKKDDFAKPSKVQEDAKPDTINGPKFDESNSARVNWEDLPAELKNATPLETKQDNKLAPTQNNKNASQPGALFSDYVYSTGFWGGNGGSYFWMNPPSGSRIYAIAIRSGAYIDRLTVWYKTSNGSVFVGGDRGGNGGSFYFQLFSDDEYIKQIDGRCGAYIDRLTIYTNRKWFTYGGNGGRFFSVSVDDRFYQILGFWGRSGAYIDQIGFDVYSRGRLF